VAALLRRELQVDPALVHGAYGQFKIEVDGRVVLDAGVMAALAVVPSNERIVQTVREALLENPA
jgi:hypothetical protein